MSEKKAITVLCGGQSAEHEISILSARNIVAALNTKKYTVSVVYITQQGSWYLLNNTNDIHQKNLTGLISAKQASLLMIAPGNPNHPWVLESDPDRSLPVDCVLPILHGTLGEEGTLQGFLEILNVPYVGCGVLGSALCMEKHITKRLLRFAKLPTSDWLDIHFNGIEDFPYSFVSEQLGETVFVKPVNLGSSVGISKVHNEKEFNAAVRDAFQYDSKIIIERYIQGREIECSVLGNDDPVASLPGEIITHHEFYSYEAKYLDPNGADSITPADLPSETVEKIQALAVDAFKVLQCSGMARVDFFVTDAQDVIINEVNPIPGFTNISLYPKNWEASGVPCSELLDDLIHLALAGHHRNQSLSHVFSGASNPEHGEQAAQEGLE